MESLKLKEIITYLYEGTSKDSLAWGNTVTDGTFQLNFGKVSVQVTCPEELAEVDHASLPVGSSGASVIIYNEDGLKIANVNELNISELNISPAVLRSIYRGAKSRVYKFKSTYDMILRELKKNIGETAN